LTTRTDGAVTGDRTRHEAANKRASDELAALPSTRPVALLQALLARELSDAALNDCHGWQDSKRARKRCVEIVEPARAELANAEAREKAQHDMADASATLATLKPSTPANSDATALARYFAAVGIVLPADRLADLISLLTVLAVEIAGAVAIALGRQSLAVAPSARQPWTAVNVQEQPRDGGTLVLRSPLNTPPQLGVQTADRRAVNAETSQTIERLKARILGDLERGPRACSQRALADELGASVGYVNRALKELASGGRVNVRASRVGTRLELATV
jgi:hypothetical protein